MSNINENKFYEALENIFTGANIEGEGGYVNLLKIKSKYYRLILKEFKKQVDEEPIIDDSFKEEFFDKLYSFFEKYFSESGSVYFVKTANYQRVYEQVYTDNKDVVLFWKTHMLYYVKSDILFQSIDVEITDDKGIKYNFFFDVGKLQAKQNNEKKQLVFTFREVKEKTEEQILNGKRSKKIFVFDVAYSEKGKKTKIDDIRKKIKKVSDIVPSEEVLQKAFNTFKKQSEVDFFINKNAEKFLTEQLDLYLHQILLNEENKFDQRRLNQLKTIKTFALKIIKFIAQFEDELVRVWNKPKFALNSNYVITLDKLSKDILDKIAKHENLPEQIKEWQELGMVDEDFNFEQVFEQDNEGKMQFEEDEILLNKKWQYLPVDTKYFKDLEIEVLSLFDNLDEALDGRLIHSENYQALNTLKEKYKEKVQCIYIDPPYNAKSSEIIYVNNYKSSSFLTFIENRLEISKYLLKDSGIYFIAIDDYEMDKISLLAKKYFYNLANITVIHNPSGRQDDKFFPISHEYMLVYALNPDKVIINRLPKTTKKLQEFKYSDKYGRYKLREYRRSGSNSRREDGPGLWYPIYFYPEDNYLTTEKKEDGGNYIELLPIDNKGIERCWRWGKETFEKKKDKYIEIKKKQNNYILYVKERESDYRGDKARSIWSNSKYASANGTNILKNILNVDNKFFQFPKSLELVKDSLRIANNDSSLILDYFAGSGTTAHAVIELNREDNGRRKYILIELGEHFNTVIIPRIKKVCFSDKWKDGKAQDGEGISQFFKYYSLEQYEDTLRNMRYADYESDDLFSAGKRVFEEYIFYSDEKFAHILEIKKDDVLEIDFDKLYKNIDFPETISNILGLHIKRITKDTVVLQDGEEERPVKYDYKNMSEEEKLEFLKILKPLLWWGK